MKLEFVNGDVTKPIGEGNKLLLHCCNDIPVMGAGVAAALAKKWPKVRSLYMQWGEEGEHKTFVTHHQLRLGEFQVVNVEGDFKKNTGIAVVNMIGQRDVCFQYGIPPVRYEAIREALYKLKDVLKKAKSSVSIHSPRFGAGLAGGDWNTIEQIIREVFDDTDISWTVYDFQ